MPTLRRMARSLAAVGASKGTPGLRRNAGTEVTDEFIGSRAQEDVGLDGPSDEPRERAVWRRAPHKGG
jgi:hypothetical protein